MSVHALDAVVHDCQRSGRSPEIALMRLLIAAEDAVIVHNWLRLHAGSSEYLKRIAWIMAENEPGCRRVASMLASSVDTPPEGGSVEEGIRFCRRLFDWSVQQSEESSVALYSFANPSLLRDATREIEQLFRKWALLGTDRTALDIGCGIGRVTQALAAHLSRVVGIDISGAMIGAARRRCSGLSNVVIQTCSGRDLSDHADCTYDLAFAVDSFPYLVQSGMALVHTYFAEASRVLRGGGDFVILDFSYRDDPSLDCHDVGHLAASYGLDVVVAGTQPFSIWDALAFHLHKPARSTAG